MQDSLIPQDPLTRKLLARVLAAMIRDDFQRLKAAANEQPCLDAAAASDAPTRKQAAQEG